MVSSKTIINTAIILAGGKGERLRPLTDDRPKPMVEVAGRPILKYQIDQLIGIGINHLVISCGYKHSVIQDYFADGSKFGLNITYSIEDSPLGRGGGIKAAMKLLPLDWQDTLVLNGDILAKVDFAKLIQTHLNSRALVTDLIIPLRSPYGIVDFNSDNQILQFREKPVLPFWINGGVYCFNQAVQDLLPDIGDHETTTFPKLPKAKFLVFKSENYWRGVDTIKDKTEADLEIPQIFTN